MNDFYKFAADHPILCVVLVLIVCETIITIVRGYSPASADDLDD